MSQTNLRSQPRRIREDALASQADHLRHALTAEIPGREREWTERVVDILVEVEKALRQHIAITQTPDGVFAEVDGTRPTLARQTEKLRQEYDELLEQCLALQRETRRAAEAFSSPAERLVTSNSPPARTDVGGVVDFGAIRQQAEQFLDAMRQNKHAETELILESINTDIGVGD